MRSSHEPLSPALSSADTVDILPADLSSAADSFAHCVGFIEGSGPGLTSETANLLRGRLRAAAGILGLAFALFFGYRLFTGDGPGKSDDTTFYAHTAVTVVLVTAFFSLCRRCAMSLTKLRVYEALIFGLPVLYFLLYDYRLMSIMVRRGYLPNPLSFWMGIVFTYAIFIPNTWRRAAIKIGLMCTAPILLFVYMAATDEVFAKAITSCAWLPGRVHHHARHQLPLCRVRHSYYQRPA